MDAAYDIHDGMKSHTGGKMLFGCVTVHCLPGKKKLNTKSSTEAELVGTSEYVPFNFWMVMFMGS